MEPNEISKKVESLFEAGGGDDDQMWKIISQFAMQIDELQILALTKLTYIAGICSPDISKRLLAFRDHYIKLHNNKDTAMFMLRITEMQSLKHYFTGIQGQVKIDK